jgi:hypothetical protein
MLKRCNVSLRNANEQAASARNAIVIIDSFVMGLAILEHRHQGFRCSRLSLGSTVKSDVDSDI